MTGLPSVGDSKMAALGTRVEMVAHGDYSLCPLSAKQGSEAELDHLLAPVFDGTQPTMDLRLPHGEGRIEATDEPVALGLEQTIEQKGPDQTGKESRWQARRLVVRSFAFAEGCVYFATTPSTLVFYFSIEPWLVSRFFLRKPVAGGHEPEASRRIWPGDCVDTLGFHGTSNTHRNRH